MQSTRRYIARETLISIIANGLVNSGVVWAAFARTSEVPLLGLGGVAIDFIPQLGAITFIGSLVPALLTRGRLKSGKFGADLARAPIELAAILRDSVFVAVCVILALGCASTAVLAAFWPGPYTFTEVFVIKSIVGCIVPFIVTPPAIGRVLSAANAHAASY